MFQNIDSDYKLNKAVHANFAVADPSEFSLGFYFKSVIASLGNNTNVTSTMASRHQMRQTPVLGIHWQ